MVNQALRAEALVCGLLLLAGCSSQPAPSGPDGSSGASGSSAGQSPTGGNGAGASAGSGPATAGGASSGGGGAAARPYYPNAPGAAALAPWTAPSIAPNLAADPGDDWHARDNTALQAFTTMFLPQTGTWNAGYRWTFANDVEAAESSYARTGGENHWDIVVTSFDKGKADNFEGEPGYDDELWWAHTWIRAYELSGNASYLAMAKTIFADATKGWEPAVCQGGLWWQKRAVYKNAVTNELFLLVAAALHNHVPNDAGPGSYLDWAQKEWLWFSNSGLINASNLINDGLGDDCKNNGQTTWTYNQGVILGALVELYQATGDATLLSRAEALADASTTTLVDANGVFRETCGGGCNGDQVSFKGIYLRNLARLYDWDHKPSYYDFMLKNARSVWDKDQDAGNRFGSDWAGPFDLADSSRQSSAMFALSALADPYSQASVFLRPSGAPSSLHATGERAGLLKWACDSSTCSSAGLMLQSSSVAYLAPGAHSLHVRAAASAIATPSAALVTIEVIDTTSQQLLGSLDITGPKFAEANVFQDFALPYTQNLSQDPVQYRVRWNALAGAPKVTLGDLSVDGEDSFSAANLEHECGRFDAAWHWSADRFGDKSTCALARGGGVRLETGDYVADTELEVDDFALDAATIATLTVIDREENKIIASLEVKRSDFGNTSFRTFTLPFHAFAGDHYDVATQWLAAPNAPRLTERGVYVRRALTEAQIALPFNQRGLGTTAGDGALDTAGNALDLALLGASQHCYGHAFALGTTGNNVLQGSADKVTVSAGRYQSLELLGFASNATQLGQSFTLSYSDGSTQAVPRAISELLSFTPQPSESIALALPYRWSKTAKDYGNFHVFHYSLPVDGKKDLSSFSLPNNPNVKILAATLTASK